MEAHLAGDLPAAGAVDLKGAHHFLEMQAENAFQRIEKRRLVKIDAVNTAALPLVHPVLDEDAGHALDAADPLQVKDLLAVRKTERFSHLVGRNDEGGGQHPVFQTDASQGFVCRQITSGGQDYSPVYVPDMSKIFFSRQETRGFSLWSYDVKDNFLSSYSTGLNPCMLDGNTALCTRMNAEGRGEIWKIDFSTGIEECIVSDLNISFSTPSVSPDGRWLVFTGGSHLDNAGRTYWNTDIYLCHMDGTGLMQLTYHAADDLSPAWSKDSRYIYFISQRGSADAIANIWRITCPVR